jgi:acyl-CoA thioesterase FadM
LRRRYGRKKASAQISHCRPSVRYVDDLAQLQSEVDRIECSRTTLTQKVWMRLSGTMAALQSCEAVVVDEDDFWNEQSVGSSKT